MSRHIIQAAVGCLVLSCVGCAVVPAPYPPPPLVMQSPTCRSTITTLKVDGKDVPGYGQECLQADGSWKPVGSPTTMPPSTPLAMPSPTYAYPPTYYAYPPPYYVYPDPYLAVYPWYFGPETVIIGDHGGWRGGGWRGGNGAWRGGGRR